MPVRTLEDFELQGQIGSGTVGRVFRAADARNYRTVALKILTEAVTSDALIKQRFYREIQVLQRLSHPNIIAYYEDGRDGESLFYTMEMVVGTSLKQVLVERKQLPWKLALECGWQICSALQHAHNHGVIHRDLKPSNLYLSKDGVVKLADFGIALDVGATEITDHGLTVGTYLYMPPEQIRGERTISGQTDLYALGCVLYEMLTGKPPFEGTNFPEIFNQHLQAEVPKVRSVKPDCPAALDELIVRLLAKNAEDRPSNAREVQGRIAEILIDNGDAEIVESLRKSAEAGTATVASLARKGSLGRTAEEGFGKRLTIVAVVIISLVVIAAVLNDSR